jgi:hypothetical protein
MMTAEPIKAQELLIALQKRSWTKADRASVRQMIDRYYERKLTGLQAALLEAISLDGDKKLDPFEIDEHIHRYHKQSQELYIFINNQSPSNAFLPTWLNMIAEDKQGMRVWQPRTKLLAEEQSHQDAHVE